MGKPRSNKIFTLIGGRDTGKTSVLKKMIRESILPKKLIIDTYDNPRWQTMEDYDYPQGINETIPVINPSQFKYWKKGTYRIFGHDTDQIKSWVDKHVKNCLVIWEDASKYYGKELTKTERRCVYDTKQKNIDAVYVFHLFRKATVEIVENSDILILKKTGDNPKVVDRKFNDDNINALLKEVNSHPDEYYYEAIYIN